MKYFLLALLTFSQITFSATVWTDQPGLYKKQKSNASVPATQYILQSYDETKAYVLKNAPIVVPTCKSTETLINNVCVANPVVVIPPVTTPVITWTKCAVESGTCTFTGTTREVRYGNATTGKYAIKTFTDSVKCGNEIFGDASPNTVKQCDISSVFTTNPVVTPPVVIVSPVVIVPTNPTTSLPINDGTGMMPYVDITKVPVGNKGRDYIDTIAQQYAPKQEGDNVNNGDFRIRCEYSHMLNDDPIVKPNQPGMSHLHTFFGNVGANANSTSGTLMASGNSTCDGGIMNRTSYWIPSVIDTRTGTPIAPTGGNFYYKTGDAKNVRPPPVGLRMIAGDMKASSAQPDRRMIWWCGDSNDTNISGDQTSIPFCAVGNHLMAILHFPNFWDGVNLDSLDHKSHVSYVHDLAHPAMIPDITYNIRYDIRVGDDTTKWRLSSDMYDKSIPGGYSFHGDYLFGWTTDPKTSRNFSEIFTEKCLTAHLNCGNSLLGDGRQFYY